MHIPLKTFLYVTLALLLISQVNAQSTHSNHVKINALENASASNLKQMVLLDARNLKVCQTSSVKGAKCLAATTFHSPKGQLASFGDIRWALGTASLKETDNILVFSHKQQDRDFLTGLLFLAGQQKISYWEGTISELQKTLGKASGQSRSIVRTHIYSGIMRDNFIALNNEIKTLQESGWQLASKRNPKLNNDQKLLVTGSSPIKNIAAFTKLYAAGQQQLLVSLNQ